MKIKTMTEAEHKRNWVDFGEYDEDEDIFSDSGKAILLPHPRPCMGREKEVWVPVSLCRLVPPKTEWFRPTIYVPYWFCCQNLRGF